MQNLFSHNLIYHDQKICFSRWVRWVIISDTETRIKYQSDWIMLNIKLGCLKLDDMSGLDVSVLNKLTHWGRVTHICVGNLTIIGSDTGLSPGRRQAIIWTNIGISSIRPPVTNFSKALPQEVVRLVPITMGTPFGTYTLLTLSV